MRVPITKNKRKSGPYPYYGASGVVDHVDNYIFDQEALRISEDGANLLARSTPIAFVASGQYWVNNHAHIYEFADQVTLKYVEYYLENIDLKPFITGAAQPKLSQGNLNKIPIFIPSVEIQKEIVTIISKAQESAHQLAGQYRVKINHLKALKQSMLTQAFSEGGVQ
jgi:type I restriction enzyme S subunit